MFKKVSVLTLVLAISLESAIAYSKPSKKRAGSNKKRVSAVKKMSKKTSVDVKDVEAIVEEKKAVVASEPVVTSTPVVETKIIDNSVTNDVDAVRAVVRDELQANNDLIANMKKKEEEKKNESLKKAKESLSSKLDNVRNECSGIKSNLDTIFGLSVATTVSSGLGTLVSGGALAVGLVKANKDKKIEEKEAELNLLTPKDISLDTSSEENLKKSVASALSDLDKDAEALRAEIAKDEKTSKTLGHVRTGLMAGATLTSAVSTGTSIGATLSATKLAEKMSSCNSALSELRLAKATAEAEEVEATDTLVVSANNILSVCTGYDEGNIKSLKNLATANSIVSGIGTMTAGAGTVTSFMANKDSVRNDNTEAGKKKEKNLNTASNILAGVTLGTSATSTTLSAVQISKAKKDSDMAEKCEKAL